jgi:hypothetical protein
MEILRVVLIVLQAMLAQLATEIPLVREDKGLLGQAICAKE